jgi:hypothetical protein
MFPAPALLALDVEQLFGEVGSFHVSSPWTRRTHASFHHTGFHHTGFHHAGFVPLWQFRAIAIRANKVVLARIESWQAKWVRRY